MKAAVLHGIADLRVEDVKTPVPEPGEVLLKVAYCGVCGSDLPRLVKDGAHYFPIILGHEFSGVIEQAGPGTDPGLVGKKAACAPLMPNFKDPQCARGHYSLGKGYDFIGSRRQGGFAEYVALPAENAVLVEDSADLLDASFLEPLTVGLHAVNCLQFIPGHSVAVTGVGNIGLLLLQSLKHLGAGSITAFDVDSHQLALAKRLGADRCVDSSDTEAMAESFAFDTVFETSGVPSAEILALKLAGPKGRVMFVGNPHTPLTLQPAEFEWIMRKELTLQGSWMNYSAPFPGWEWTFGAGLMAKGLIEVQSLVGKIVPLSEAGSIPSLLQGPDRVKGKILVDCRI